MEIKAILEKPYNEKQKIDFIVENNHILGYEIKKTSEELQAWGFTTAEIKVDMGGISQNISKDTDADAIIDYLVRGVTQGMQSAAEGVYA